MPAHGFVDTLPFSTQKRDLQTFCYLGPSLGLRSIPSMCEDWYGDGEEGEGLFDADDDSDLRTAEWSSMGDTLHQTGKCKWQAHAAIRRPL
jgi:hypothetical protein